MDAPSAFCTCRARLAGARPCPLPERPACPAAPEGVKIASMGRIGERTMAEAEQDANESRDGTRCACGSQHFVLEAWLEVDLGRITPEPIEVEALTCPECGREYEPVLTADGGVTRGEFRGYFEEDDT